METEVKRRIISGEEARNRLESLISKLGEFDALEANFLLSAVVTSEVRERDSEWIRSIGEFRTALHEAALHGHYNLMQAWEWPRS